MLRVLLRCLLLGVVVALSVACEEPASIVFWHPYRGEEERTLIDLAKRYEAEHHVRVELLGLPFDAYTAKLAAAVPHGHGPDAFIDAHERLGIYREEGIVAPVGDAFPDKDLLVYDPAAVTALTLNHVRWGIPLGTKCVALYVNDDLLSSVPPLDSLEALHRELKPGISPLVYEAETPYYHAAILSAYGGTLLEPNGDYGFVGPAAFDSVDFVKALLARGDVPEDASGALVKELFGSGRAAMAIDGPWLAAELPAGLHYHVEPLPLVSHGLSKMHPPLTVELVMLSPSGAQKSEVRAFARWLGGKTSAVERAVRAHQVVANEDAWKDPRLASDRLLAAFHEEERLATPMTTSTRMRAAWVPAQEALRRIVRGEDPNLALEDGKRRFEDALKPPPSPPSPAPLVVLSGFIALAGAFYAVKRARSSQFRTNLRASAPAYRYLAHAVVVILVLVVFPLVAGAVASFFAGTRTHPHYVGLGNYLAILTARGGPLLGHGSFYLTLLVTILWTVCNVTLHLALGVVLALVLSRPVMKLKAPYRMLLVLPWAVPSYVTALAWKGMFHRQFGLINALLGHLGVEPISWFSHFATAFTANVATNVWLGFPFMMVVMLGALTSIPKEILEAAEVDGATPWERFWGITVPLLRPTMLPAVVLGSIWTFNMFNVVFLVSGGEPDGSTDILLSDAYRWAFTRDAQYGYAAAYAVLIFIILALGSRVLTRLGGAREAVV